MRTLRRFYTGLAFSAIILTSNCTLSDDAEVEDGLEAADAGNQIVEVQQDEVADSEIPAPEQAAEDGQPGTETAGESIDGNSSNIIQELGSEQQATHKGPQLPEGNPDEASDYQMAQDQKAAQPESDIAPAADNLPSLSEVVAESDTPTPAAGQDSAAMIGATDAGLGLDSAPAKAGKSRVRKSSTLSGNFYIVQPGDTLGRISTILYGTPRRWQDLASANSLEANTPIYPGDVIRYPEDATSSEFALAYKNLPRSQIVVQKGDTLALIAERQLGNAAYWKLVWRWNESLIADPNKIFEGQSLEYIAPQELSALLSDRKGLKAAH